MSAAPRFVAVAASDGTADLVTGPRRRVQVVATSRRAAYLTVDPSYSPEVANSCGHAPAVLSVVVHDGARQPCALQFTSPRATRVLAAFGSGRIGAVGDGRLTIGPWCLRVVRWWRARPAIPPVPSDRLAAGVAKLAAVRAGTELTAAGVSRLGGALVNGDLVAALAAADTMIGRGPGTTPDGDDVLAGLVATASLLGPAAGLGTQDLACVRRVAERMVARAPGRTTSVSAGLLAHAARGEVVDDVAAVITALASGTDPVPAAHRLVQLGASSGSALLYGVVAGCELVVRLVPHGDHVGRARVPARTVRGEAA